MNLDRLSMFFDFSITYTTEHPNLPRDFEVTDQMLTEFREFLKEKEFTYKGRIERGFEDFKEVVENNEETDRFSPEFADIQNLIEAEKEGQFDESVEYIRRGIKRDILTRLYGESAVYEQIVLENDPYVEKAVEILATPSEYASILGG
jgi:carboxyl-terminal processing protease